MTPGRGRAPAALSVLALISYGTSFLRERFLLQEALGTTSLDNAVAAYAVAALVGNLWATVLSLVWIDGRRIPRWASAFGAYAIAGVVLMPLWPLVGSCVGLASLIAACDFGRQRSVFRGRQREALLAAVVAPAASVAFWAVAGVESLSAIVTGYALGYAVQAAGAWWHARQSEPNAPSGHHHVSVAWPVAFAAFSQLNGMLDRLLLPFAGAGWAGAGGLSMNLMTAAMLIVVAPIASEAVAGRARTQVSRRTVATVLAATVAVILAVPSAMPVLLEGGLVVGTNLDRIEALTVVYLISLPGVAYWTFRSRALQASARTWRPVALAALSSLVAHAMISVPALVTGHPLGVASGSVIGGYVGAFLLAREVAD